MLSSEARHSSRYLGKTSLPTSIIFHCGAFLKRLLYVNRKYRTPAIQWFKLKASRSSHKELDKFKTMPCSEAGGVGSEAAMFALLWKRLPCLCPPGVSSRRASSHPRQTWLLRFEPPAGVSEAYFWTCPVLDEVFWVSAGKLLMMMQESRNRGSQTKSQSHPKIGNRVTWWKQIKEKAEAVVRSRVLMLSHAALLVFWNPSFSIQSRVTGPENGN